MPDAPDEVLASEIFCDAHGFSPGDRVAAIINGRRRRLTIVGIALSPDTSTHIGLARSSPTIGSFGIFWMEPRALASAFNMEGGFNDVSHRASRQGRRTSEAIAGSIACSKPTAASARFRGALQTSAGPRQRAAQLRTSASSHRPSSSASRRSF